VTDAACDSGSWRELGQGHMLSRDWMQWAWECYVPDAARRGDPLASPLKAAEFADQPPATIITADHDPLRDEAEAYAARLREAGVAVTARRYLGVIHGFASLPFATPVANRALADVAADLRAALTA
jgi:acetyl esterase